MKRIDFIKHAGLAATALALDVPSAFAQGRPTFPVVRVAEGQRKFKSPAVERLIREFSARVKNEELAWLFSNCFPNTLDTTVDFEMINGKPDTYVITGDIDAMWLRDSTAQVWPYLRLMKEDPGLQQLIAGVINRQVRNIQLDPYANAFYKDPAKVSEWKDDITEMKPGIHERKWEIDSLCYPLRLAYHYWKTTGDVSPFDAAWKDSIRLTLNTFREHQRKDGPGPYSFQRRTSWATDGVPLSGYGYPGKPVGLIFSVFRPSDDATLFPFLVPANFFAVVSLRQAAEMLEKIHKDTRIAAECTQLAAEVEQALNQYAIVQHPRFGKIYAYEINGYGSYNLMDDANVPSLLSLPYLDAMPVTDPIYQNTRKFLLSDENPFFYSGKAGEGIGGPHAGIDMIWPLSVIIRALTSRDDAEIRKCIRILQQTHGGKGFMHEAFHKDDAAKFTRAWFAWANTIFGELLYRTLREKPSLLI